MEGVSAAVAHELAPVRMLIREAAELVGGPASDVLLRAAEHLGMVGDCLPGIISGVGVGLGDAPVEWEEVGAAVEAAAMFCPSVPDLSLPDGMPRLLVPAPHARVVLRNVLSNAHAHAGGVAEVIVSVDGGSAVLEVVERPGAGSSSGSGLGVAIVDMLLFACGGSLERRYDRGSASSVVRLPVLSSCS